MYKLFSKNILVQGPTSFCYKKELPKSLDAIKDLPTRPTEGHKLWIGSHKGWVDEILVQEIIVEYPNSIDFVDPEWNHYTWVKETNYAV